MSQGDGDFGTERVFPELPPWHPLKHVPFSIEHGHVWLNCAFAADCCVLVDGRHFFLHAAFVQRDCDFFNGWLTSGMSVALRFGQVLELPFPKTFGFIIDWIYTRKRTFMEHDCLFEVYQTGKYLGVNQEFLDEILAEAVNRWVTSEALSQLTPPALSSVFFPLAFVRKLFAERTAADKPLDGDTRLLVLMHWARLLDCVEVPDIIALWSEVEATIRSCTDAGIQRAMKLAPRTFAATVNPSVSALRRADHGATKDWPKAELHSLKCLRCYRTFRSKKTSQSVLCNFIQRGHSPNAFISSSGTICCATCMKPLHSSPCSDIYHEHELVPRDVHVRPSKRRRSGE